MLDLFLVQVLAWADSRFSINSQRFLLAQALWSSRGDMVTERKKENTVDTVRWSKVKKSEVKGREESDRS